MDVNEVIHPGHDVADTTLTVPNANILAICLYLALGRRRRRRRILAGLKAARRRRRRPFFRRFLL